MKKSNLGIGLSIVLLAISLVFLVVLAQLDFLPSIYLLLILGFYLPMIIVLPILMMVSKIKKIVRICAEIVSFVLIIIVVIVSFALFQTTNLFHVIQAKNYQFENYRVIVLQESEASHLTDVKNQIGVVVDSFGTYRSALDTLKKKTKVTEQIYKTPIALAEALLEQSESFILLNESYDAIIRRQIPEFEEKTKQIGTISIKVQNGKTDNQAELTTPFQVYIVGSDTTYDVASRTTNYLHLLYTVNPKTHQALKIELPSNYYLQLPNTEGYRDYLGTAGSFGMETSIQAVEGLLDTDIPYYIKLKLPNFLSLLDVVGSVTVESDMAFAEFQEGKNTITRKNALAYIQNCNGVQCGTHANQLWDAIIKKMTWSKSVFSYTKLIKILGASIETNLPKQQLDQFLKAQLQELNTWKLEITALEGYGSLNYTYLDPDHKSYIIEPDLKQIEEVKAKMKLVQGE